MSDAVGLVQFLNAVAEIARGAPRPSLLPVWDRHLLTARDPPRVTHTHLEYAQVPNSDFFPPPSTLAHRSFFFSHGDLAVLRRHQLHHHSTFEILTALLWKCRTIAMSTDPEEEVRVVSVVNARAKLNPPLPEGYYGNVVVFRVAVTKAGRLMEKPLEYAAEMVRRAKEEATEEYVTSAADLMATTERRRSIPSRGTWIVSDVRRAGFVEVDYGWGKAVYGGPAALGRADQIGVSSPFLWIKKYYEKGVEGVVVPMYLPGEAMERLEKMIRGMASEVNVGSRRGRVSSL